MKFILYQSKVFVRRGQWRWRLLARNGRKVAVSGEGYNNKADCIAAIDLVRGSAQVPTVEKV